MKKEVKVEEKIVKNFLVELNWTFLIGHHKCKNFLYVMCVCVSSYLKQIFCQSFSFLRGNQQDTKVHLDKNISCIAN